MNIVIVGDGKVGSTLTELLSKEGHDIVVIDSSPKVIDKIVNSFDVNGMVGNGASYKVQMEAGVSKAHLLIAVTSTDEVNLLCCMVAKKLGVKHTIARVRNPDYLSQLALMRDDFGLSMVVNPELDAANEISRILRFPSAIKLDTFAKGRVDLAELRLGEGNPLCGMVISDIHRVFNVKTIIAAVQREDEVFIPNGSFILREGDRISITASHVELAAFMRKLGVFKESIKRVMLVGGGKIAYYLARQLEEIHIAVTIVEKDPHRCIELTEALPKARIINGDGSDQSVLTEEGIDGVDACVALTGIDEENIVISMYAYTRHIRKVITKIDRISFLPMLDTIGLESVIEPKTITSSNIVRYVRSMQNSAGSSVQGLSRIVNDKVEALEFRVLERSSFVGVKLSELKLKNNLLIACIVRNNKLIFPKGDDCMEVNDSVVVVTTNKYLRELENILA